MLCNDTAYKAISDVQVALIAACKMASPLTNTLTPLQIKRVGEHYGRYWADAPVDVEGVGVDSGPGVEIGGCSVPRVIYSAQIQL